MMRAGKGVDPSSVGRVPPYAWPGGYPIVCIVRTSNRYHAADGIWCPDCANHAAWHIPAEGEDPDTLTLVMADVYWEGAPMACDCCEEMIESAYGDPDDDDDESEQEVDHEAR